MIEHIAETVDAFRIKHHLYADDTQLQDHIRIATIQAKRLNLELCIDAIKDWCAAVCLVAGQGVRDHVTPAMRELHWLQVTFRVQYKLCLMVHSSVNGCSPEYITDVLVPMSSLQGRATLRSSSSGSFDMPRTRTCFGERAFSVAGSTAWNKLPPNLRLITDNYRFKRVLKAHLFSIAYCS